MKSFNLLFLTITFLFGLFANAQSAANYEWKNVGIGGGGFVSSIIAAPNEPNVFYARTDVGGAYRWDEATNTWIPLTDWVSVDERGLLGIDGIAIDPSVAGRVYMLAGTSYWNNGKTMFLRSDDGGDSWDKVDVTSQFRAHGNGMGRGNGERIAVDPNNSNIIFCGTRYDGLWKSVDRGSNWTQVSTFPVTTTLNESGICALAFDPNTVSNGTTQRIYAGVSQENDNLYVSDDAGASWSLVTNRPTTARIMPQRFELSSNGQFLYVTYGNGAGPHAHLWGGVQDYYNRGAVYKYDTLSGVWSDISPENFMLDLDRIEDGPNQAHYGAYSGISIDPSNENRILVSSINSWRGTQYWNLDGSWVNGWGDNIFLSEDGGSTWRSMFRFYWTEGGMYPDYTIMDENGIPWIGGQTCHWIGAAVIDPNNSNRAFVTSGNGIFGADNLLETELNGSSLEARATWKFKSHGIEETVPYGVVSLADGPVVSVIADYDGFVHDDVDGYPVDGRHRTMINGAYRHHGTTVGLAAAAQNTNILAKASGNLDNTCGVTVSSDGGRTWNQLHSHPTPVSLIPDSGELHNGRVALSADGNVIIWAPYSNQSSGSAPHPELFRHENSSWTKCSGIEFSGRPVADTVNPDIIYIYNRYDGYMYVSVDKGVSFAQAGFAGTGGFATASAALGIEGEIWVPLADGGLVKSSDIGISFDTIASVSYCEAVGFGKELEGTGFPAVYIHGTIGSTNGVFRSTDEGLNWTRINDDEHQYGGLANGEFVVGDLNVFGRVYMSTAGRGIVYGEPGDGSPPVVAVSGVNVSPANLALGVGATGQLAAAITPSNASNKNVTWTSSNASVATVSQTGQVSAQSNGSATITATTADGGYTDTCIVTVDTNNVPVAVVAATPTSGNAPLVVNFDATESSDADGDSLTYNWDFGDSSTGSGETISHSYTGPGTYTATLTVSDGQASSQATTSITVSGQSLPCENPVAINLDFVQEGSGQYCWSTTQPISYINSWAMTTLTINGVDYTNTWSNQFPEPIDGVWYIYYEASQAWSHFEAHAQ